MRCAVLLLFLSAVVAAEDDFAADLRAFREVEGRLTTPGAKDRIHPALEKLIEGGDARAVEPLARYLVETIASEDATLLELKKVQQRAAEAREKLESLDKDIGRLGRKVEAGDRSAAPEFEKLLESRKQAARVYEGLFARTNGFGRTIMFLRELRTKVAAGLAKILAGLQGEPLTGALAQLRAALDVANPQQALFLVEILRESRQSVAAGHLIEIIDHPKVEPRVRVAAVVALGGIRTTQAYAALVRIGERDEAMRPQILHALGMAAAQRFTDLETAKAWVAKQS